MQRGTTTISGFVFLPMIPDIIQLWTSGQASSTTLTISFLHFCMSPSVSRSLTPTNRTNNTASVRLSLLGAGRYSAPKRRHGAQAAQPGTPREEVASGAPSAFGLSVVRVTRTLWAV